MQILASRGRLYRTTNPVRTESELLTEKQKGQGQGIWWGVNLLLVADGRSCRPFSKFLHKDRRTAYIHCWGKRWMWSLL